MNKHQTRKWRDKPINAYKQDIIDNSNSFETKNGRTYYTKITPKGRKQIVRHDKNDIVHTTEADTEQQCP